MTTTASSLTASVGIGGTNAPADVRIVQDLLNRAAHTSLAVDGVCGPDTRQAITDYQAGFLRNPDGRVDPGGQTLRRLEAAARDRAGPPRSDPTTAAGPADGLRLTQFPARGNGHYAYSSPDRQYGTDAMLQLLTSTTAALHRAGLEVGVGDISFQQGGTMPPHSTHRAGRHVDLRPLRTDNARGPVSIGDPRYSRESTRTLVETLLAQGSVRRILFNDAEITDVRHFPGHDNHLHIELSQ
ncbi:peptidoglycan-binding protein [Streptomyces sp. NBC_00490]|uniref:peptidoglycan-binding domain-containing protein n=1 Tax=Streptomyces sp. NBC_00490 TaxID=2903657 RepID=UPI002E18F1EB